MGGDLPIACWPYDGQMFWKGYLDGVAPSLCRGAEVTTWASRGHKTEKIDCVFIDHED